MTEIVDIEDRLHWDIRYARKRGKKPWRIVVFRDPDDAIIQLVERQKRGEG